MKAFENTLWNMEYAYRACETNHLLFSCLFSSVYKFDNVMLAGLGFRPPTQYRKELKEIVENFFDLMTYGNDQFQLPHGKFVASVDSVVSNMKFIESYLLTLFPFNKTYCEDFTKPEELGFFIKVVLRQESVFFRLPREEIKAIIDDFFGVASVEKSETPFEIVV